MAAFKWGQEHQRVLRADADLAEMEAALARFLATRVGRENHAVDVGRLRRRLSQTRAEVSALINDGLVRDASYD